MRDQWQQEVDRKLDEISKEVHKVERVAADQKAVSDEVKKLNDTVKTNDGKIIGSTALVIGAAGLILAVITWNGCSVEKMRGEFVTMQVQTNSSVLALRMYHDDTQTKFGDLSKQVKSAGDVMVTAVDAHSKSVDKKIGEIDAKFTALETSAKAIDDKLKTAIDQNTARTDAAVAAAQKAVRDEILARDTQIERIVGLRLTQKDGTKLTPEVLVFEIKMAMADVNKILLSRMDTLTAGHESNVAAVQSAQHRLDIATYESSIDQTTRQAMIRVTLAFTNPKDGAEIIEFLKAGGYIQSRVLLAIESPPMTMP